MTITNIKQLIDIVLDSSRKGYIPELVINGEIYDIWIEGIISFPESRQAVAPNKIATLSMDMDG